MHHRMKKCDASGLRLCGRPCSGPPGGGLRKPHNSIRPTRADAPITARPTRTRQGQLRRARRHRPGVQECLRPQRGTRVHPGRKQAASSNEKKPKTLSLTNPWRISRRLNDWKTLLGVFGFLNRSIQNGKVVVPCRPGSAHAFENFLRARAVPTRTITPIPAAYAEGSGITSSATLSIY